MLSRKHREALARALFEDSLSAAIKSNVCRTIWAVTSDQSTADFAQSKGANVLREDRAADLNSAIDFAVDHLEKSAAQSICVLSADLPYLTTSDICAISETDKTAIIIDKTNLGTNGLRFNIAKRLRFAYGQNSAERHLQQLSADDEVIRRTGLAEDLDTPIDMQRIRIAECGPKVKQALRDSSLFMAVSGDKH